MTEKRKATKEDILLKTRLIAEGARFDVRGEYLWESKDAFIEPIVIFDECDIVTETRSNPRSRIDLILEGSNVTIAESGEVLATGTLEPRAPWRDLPMRGGGTVNDRWTGSTVANYIYTSPNCYAAASGKGCKFCGAGIYFASGPVLSLDETLTAAEPQIEATVIAAEAGWRGGVDLIGGAQPPWRRDQWTTDLFEGIMTRFHALLDDNILSQLRFFPSVYPPNDLGQLYKWKSVGITSVEFDSQVMDPDYFKAICPGRGDQKHWFDAQEAAVEIFADGGGCTSLVVTGIEPMEGLLKGIEERISKGVKMHPVIYKPWPGSPMGEMQPASAEWYVEMFEKVDAIRSKYGHPTFGVGPIAQSDEVLKAIDEDLSKR